MGSELGEVIEEEEEDAGSELGEVIEEEEEQIKTDKKSLKEKFKKLF